MAILAENNGLSTGEKSRISSWLILLYSGVKFEASQVEGPVNPLTGNHVHRHQLRRSGERAPASSILSMIPRGAPHTELQSQTMGEIWMSRHHIRDRGPRMARPIL